METMIERTVVAGVVVELVRIDYGDAPTDYVVNVGTRGTDEGSSAAFRWMAEADHEYRATIRELLGDE